MRTLPLLAQLLACPDCHAQLKADEAGLACTGCLQDYPLWGDLPWLLPRAKAYRADWGQRLKFYLQTMERELQRLKLEQKLPDILPATGERLRLLIQAKTEQLREIDKLLEDLKLGEDPAYELNALAGTPLPEQQSLFGYYGNVLRDWGWGEAENAAALDCVRAVAGEGALGMLGVLGSGPSRLAYDLHRAYPGTTTLAMDINPFYLQIASRMSAGKTLHLYDFPIAPRNLKNFAVKVRLKAPEPIKEGLHFVLADALRPCLKPASLDTLLTPWLIDVIPDDFRLFAARMNQLLKPGGRWLNFGSLVFHQHLTSQCYSREEVESILAEEGFEILKKTEREIPYLSAAHNSQTRLEWIFAFSARKIRSVPPPGAPGAAPISWLEDQQEKIPVWPELQEQILFNHTLAVILAQVNGARSLNEIAELLAPQMGMTQEQTQVLLKRVLEKTYQSRTRSRVFS